MYIHTFSVKYDISPENSTEEKRSPQGHLMSIVKSTMLVR